VSNYSTGTANLGHANPLSSSGGRHFSIPIVRTAGKSLKMGAFAQSRLLNAAFQSVVVRQSKYVRLLRVAPYPRPLSRGEREDLHGLATHGRTLWSPAKSRDVSTQDERFS